MPFLRHHIRPILAVLAGAIALAALVGLERRGAGVQIETLRIGATPATLYRAPGDAPARVAVLAHGFAGSRQMMAPLALSLAKGGVTVLSFDFIGHGRHPDPLSPDIARIEGTTQQLIAQTRAVIARARDLPGATGPVALVGHSMATDILIRAARRETDIGPIAAISMYSEAVTAERPSRLLIVSGGWERRLRGVALEAVHQIDPDTAEGETARAADSADVARRAVAAPGVEHLGVLYAAKTHAEIAAWLGADPPPRPWSGPLILALLGALVVLGRLGAGLIPAPPIQSTPPIPTGRFLVLALIPAPAAVGAALAVEGGVLGLAGFNALLAFAAVWGGVQLVLIPRAAWATLRPAPMATLALLIWGLGVFALALDRYGAAFVPLGPRLPLAGLLALGTVPFLLADSLLAQGAPLWRRLLLRALPLAALTVAIALAPTRVGLVFTALPVLLLFYLVYGTLGRAIALRAGPAAAGPALGLILAWAWAASTPLFHTP